MHRFLYRSVRPRTKETRGRYIWKYRHDVKAWQHICFFIFLCFMTNFKTREFRGRVSPTNLVSHDFWRQIITLFSSYKSQSTTHSVNVTSVSYFEKNQRQTFLWPGKFRHSITKLVICAVPWCNLVQKLNIFLDHS